MHERATSSRIRWWRGLWIFSPRPLYEIYAGACAELGFTAVADQQFAGPVMALGSFLATLVAFTALFFLGPLSE